MNEVDMPNLALRAAAEHDAMQAEEHNAKAILDDFFKKGYTIQPIGSSDQSEADRYIQMGKRMAFDQLRAECLDRALRLQVQPDKILEYAEKFYEFVTKK